MKRIRLMAILIGCVAIYFIVTFSYATNSVLTSNQISEIWGAVDCRKCIPPTAFQSKKKLECKVPGVCAGAWPCGMVTENRIAGYCSNLPNDDYDCHMALSRPMTRNAYCLCDADKVNCTNSVDYKYSNFEYSCHQTRRNETCD